MVSMPVKMCCGLDPHALDVGLKQRGEIADAHRRQRAGPHQRFPAVADGIESGDEDAQEDSEGGGFRSGGEECGDGSRRALVDIGRPDLEWRRRHLEREADEHEHRNDIPAPDEPGHAQSKQDRAQQ